VEIGELIRKYKDNKTYALPSIPDMGDMGVKGLEYSWRCGAGEGPHDR